MEPLLRVAERALGLGREARDLETLQMVLRAAIVYMLVVVMVRASKKRFIGQATAFDMILGMMLGSVASRAVTGNAPFGPALAAVAALLAMHWLFSLIAMRSGTFGNLIKGEPRTIIRDGRVDEEAMRREHMSGRDLEEDLRSEGLDSPAPVAEGRLERNGGFTVIRRADRGSARDGSSHPVPCDDDRNG